MGYSFVGVLVVGVVMSIAELRYGLDSTCSIRTLTSRPKCSPTLEWSNHSTCRTFRRPCSVIRPRMELNILVPGFSPCRDGCRSRHRAILVHHQFCSLDYCFRAFARHQQSAVHSSLRRVGIHFRHFEDPVDCWFESHGR